MDSCKNNHPIPHTQPGPGAAGAWARLLDNHQDSLRRLVSAKLQGQGESAIDDVLQEVAIAAHKVEPSSIDATRVHSWLCQVASNKVNDHWRSVSRQQKLRDRFTEKNDYPAETAASPSEWVMKLEQRSSITTALKSMQAEDRIILEKKYLHGHSYDEIAKSLNLTIKALEYRLTKARQKMRELLQDL